MPTPYSINFLQALNDWQYGGVHNKSTRGPLLKKLARNLPPHVTSTSLCCFRRLDLPPSTLLELRTEALSESISSWTFDLSVATRLWGGDPEPDRETLIFAIAPGTGNVILNVAALYREPEFIEACERHKNDIWRFELGIGWYGDSQQELILELGQLDTNSVVAIGAYSDDLRPLAAHLLERDQRGIGDLRATLSGSRLRWMIVDKDHRPSRRN
jgi:hypothetical protein